MARYLAYHCGLDVVTVDAVGCHLKAASKFDRLGTQPGHKRQTTRYVFTSSNCFCCSEVEKDLVKKARKLKAENTTAYSTGSISHMESVVCLLFFT